MWNDTRIHRAGRRVAAFLTVLTCLIGLAALAGAWFDVPRLTQILPGESLGPHAAAGLILTSVGVLLVIVGRRRLGSILLAAIVALAASRRAGFRSRVLPEREET